MLDPRYRFLLLALLMLACIWLLAAAGYGLAGDLRVTPEKITALLRDTNMSELEPQERATMLQRVADMVKALEPDEREAWARVQLAPGQPGQRWLMQMTGEEKAALMAATMPQDFKTLMQKLRPRRHGEHP